MVHEGGGGERREGGEDFREYNGKTLIGEKCETPGKQGRGGKLEEQNRQLNHPTNGESPLSRENPTTQE